MQKYHIHTCQYMRYILWFFMFLWLCRGGMGHKSGWIQKHVQLIDNIFRFPPSVLTFG